MGGDEALAPSLHTLKALDSRDRPTHFGVFYRLPGMYCVLGAEKERKLEYVALIYYLQNLRKSPQKQVDFSFV